MVPNFENPVVQAPITPVVEKEVVSPDILEHGNKKALMMVPYAAVVAGVAWPNDPSVTEIEDEVSPADKSQSEYFVLSPPPDGNGGSTGDMVASSGCDEMNNRRNQEGKMDHILHQAKWIILLLGRLTFKWNYMK